MQEPLVSFHSADELRSALWPHTDVSSFGEDSPFQKLIEKGLPPIVSIRALGVILGINPKLISAISKFPQAYYRPFILKKKSGEDRQILAPRVFLKTIQRYILRSILEPQAIPGYINGFVTGRGIVSNGQAHRGAPFLLNVDLADFFGSVQERTVERFFHDLGFSAHVARTLAALCTFQGSLPQGAPTSPYLSNLVFAPVDQDILRLCSQYELTYSRYADDLTFSSGKKIPRGFLVELEAIVGRFGFRINSAKTRFAGPGQARYVTGFVVNEKVHPSRELRRKLRAMFHMAKRNPRKYRQRAKELLGWASFVNSYDPKIGQKYLDVAKRVNANKR